MKDGLPALRTVLAAYRSTDAHVTEEQITAAWVEYEEVRDRLADLEIEERDGSVSMEGQVHFPARLQRLVSPWRAARARTDQEED